MSSYIKKPQQVQYVIRSLSEGNSDLGGAIGAFWSNEDGWGCLQAATLYSTHERINFHLPISAKQDAEWMLLEEAQDLVASDLKLQEIQALGFLDAADYQEHQRVMQASKNLGAKQKACSIAVGSTAF